MNVIERADTAHTENSLGNHIYVSCCKQNLCCVNYLVEKAGISALVFQCHSCYAVPGGHN